MNTIRHRYAVGPLIVEVHGTSAIADLVRSELEPLISLHDKPLDVEFIFLDRIAIPTGLVRARNLLVGDGVFYAQHVDFSYCVEKHTENSHFTVRLAPSQKRQKTLNLARYRFINWNYLTPIEIAAKNFFYGIFDYVCQMALIRHRATFLHASAMETPVGGIAISGVGGVGKSSLLLKTVLSGGGKYISDDLAILGADGTLWRSPKRIQVYGYNAEGDPAISHALLNQRSRLDVAAWHLRRIVTGSKRVRRRVSAEDLFGPTSVSASAPLTRFVHLERHNSFDQVAARTRVEEMAARASHVLIDEIAPFSEISALCHACADAPALPSVSAMQGAVAEVISAALSNSENWNLRVPLGTPPNELLALMREILRI